MNATIPDDANVEERDNLRPNPNDHLRSNENPYDTAKALAFHSPSSILSTLAIARVEWLAITALTPNPIPTLAEEGVESSTSDMEVEEVTPVGH